MAKKNERDTNTLGELKQHLKMKEPGRLYVFHGEEAFLLNHYLGQIKKILLDELTESFNFHKLTSETFDIRSFADCVENLPMMAERTMVWVDDIDIFKLNESDREKLCQVLTDIPDYCTIVFTYDGAMKGQFSLPLILEEGNIHFLGLPSKRFAGTPLNDSIVMNRRLVEKHYNRKHGANAYYGQKK